MQSEPGGISDALSFNKQALPFALWLLREAEHADRFVVRYEVQAGMGSLRLAGMGTVTPTLRRGRLGGLSAQHLRQGRFMLFSPGQHAHLREHVLWGAEGDPRSLPAGKWVRMVPVAGGLIPKGWRPELTAIEDCITDILPTRGGLQIAMDDLRGRWGQRRRRAPLASLARPAGKGAPVEQRVAVELAAGAAPPGAAPHALVRHLRRTIERQRMELESLRSEVARLRGAED